MKQKLAVMAMVTAMVCLSLVNVSPSASAGDVGGSVVQDIISSPVGIIMNDVAWNADGSMALVVGMDSNGNGEAAAWYNPATDTWTYITSAAYPVGYTLTACEWCEPNNMFYAVGDANGGSVTAFYLPDGSTSFTGLDVTGFPFPYNALEDIAVDVFGNGLAVGPSDIVYFFNNSGGTWSVVGDGEADSGMNYYDVDYEEAYQRFYIVGETTAGGTAMITYTDQIPDATTVPANHWNYLPAQLGNYPGFYSIAWNNDPDLPIVDRYAIVGGNDVLVGIKSVDLGGQFFKGNYPLGYYEHVSWDESTWDEATIISNRAGVSTIYQFINSSKDVVLLASLTSDNYTAIDYKPPASPGWGFIVGSAGGYQLSTNAFYSDTTITVNVDVPHIFSIDMWKTSDGTKTSTLNTRVNVDETYTFYAEVNYTIGGIDEFFDGNDNIRMELVAWYDGGSAPSTQRSSTDQNRTRQFVVYWNESASGFAGVVGWKQYPSTDANEFILDSVGVISIPSTDHYGIYINVTFGPQTWAADGGNFANGASGDIHNTVLSYNDPDSWDFRMTLYDNDFTSSQNQSYEEFGIFRFTNITASGNPGGNAPPGSSNVALGNSQLQVSSNIPYYVNVSIPRLNNTNDNTKFIPATSINVSLASVFANNTNTQMNASWGPNGRAFPGANLQLGIWGNASQVLPANWMVAAPLNSTTAHGPQGEDFQTLGATQIQWYVNVPGGTAEGIYQATITFRIGYY